MRRAIDDWEGPRRSARAVRRFLGVTEREMEVLAILPEGLSNKQIAVRPVRFEEDRREARCQLDDKLEVPTGAQLAVLATAKTEAKNDYANVTATMVRVD